MRLPRDVSSGATCVDFTEPLPGLPSLLRSPYTSADGPHVRFGHAPGSGPQRLEADFHWTNVPLSLLPCYWYNPEVYTSYMVSRMTRV